MKKDHIHKLKKEDEAYDESFNKYNQKKFNQINLKRFNQLKNVALQQLQGNNVLKSCELFEKTVSMCRSLYGESSDVHIRSNSGIGYLFQ